ncbi:tRNA 2-thiocytidine biosynthesis TtcA family protein [Candidatus Xianfuyuplasma coldseepsis]|uniref:tRNA 2-thiocytidine biosynthesis protein TtcA n=1 Tax=Candidatus Xianfuyuplasma coldseepsis TaxID=2782163 RepID=A0A7L7KRD4_9MOLU|nr:ATP-binding protein [Xianfuyuplasma coldseepsis]QMS84969.1 tRNA 2-thiocytidine biosynthesis protein TtcA [Xianfuyuplasma coldseepsis]
MNTQQNFERDIIKTYRKQLWSPFIKAIKKYKLIEEGDKVAVAVSGGKDSLLLAKLFQELQKHPLMKFDVEFISMDPGYNEINRTLQEENSHKLGISLTVEPSNIFTIVEKIANDYPCYMCARMRRGFLYNMAQKLGCNKLALGHHFDDIIETTMLNILYSGNFRTMLPKVPSKNFENMELIRPMAFIKESDIIKIMKNNSIETMDCGCEIQVCSVSSKRQRVKQLIRDLKQETDEIDRNIYKAAENVDLDGIIGWIEADKERKTRYDE